MCHIKVPSGKSTCTGNQNRTDDLDLAKIPIAFVELNSRRMNYFGKALLCFAIIVN